MLKTVKHFWTLIALLLVACSWWGAAPLLAGSETEEKKPVFPYGNYAYVLDEYVDKRGRVDYKALKRDRRRLDSFVRSLGRLSRSEYNKWPKDAKIAFWVNAYNAITMRIIIDNYPIEAGFFASWRYPENSIRQIDDVFDGIYFPVMGKEMTLDDIEHETLRKKFNEPRIHVALVCAAESCPTLRTEPFVGHKLDKQLKEQGEDFVRWSDNFRVRRSEDTVYISSIFKWFGEDFIKKYGTRTEFQGHSAKIRAVLNYLSKHVTRPQRSYLLSADYSVEYLDYDWTLNEQ